MTDFCSTDDTPEKTSDHPIFVDCDAKDVSQEAYVAELRPRKGLGVDLIVLGVTVAIFVAAVFVDRTTRDASASTAMITAPLLMASPAPTLAADRCERDIWDDDRSCHQGQRP
jgi:hypothetical protein